MMEKNIQGATLWAKSPQQNFTKKFKLFGPDQNKISGVEDVWMKSKS